MFGWLSRFIGLPSPPLAPAPQRMPPRALSIPDDAPQAEHRAGHDRLRVEPRLQSLGSRSDVGPPCTPAEAEAPRPQAPASTRLELQTGTAEAINLQTGVPEVVSRPTVRLKAPVCRVVIEPGRGVGSSVTTTSGARRRDEVRWIAPGRNVTVKGFEIPGGMVYVGNFLTANPGSGWNSDTPAPCLINPSLKVASGRAHTGADMGYWPSYSQITPEHRLTYLIWLASGRRDASFPVGYAFLFFYGVERRLLVDNPSAAEEELLVAEVKRLGDLYAANHSFSRYSKALLDVVAARRLSAGPSGLDDWRPDLGSTHHDMPLPLKVKVAVSAAHGIPIDFEHAMVGMLALPAHQRGVPATIAMTRTREEFVELVRRRFVERFPDGFRLPDRKNSKLALSYHAASQHLAIVLRVQGVNRLPDPTELSWTRMAELCAKAAEDLEAYAKVVGKDRRRADSLNAALALPSELADVSVFAPFRRWLEGLGKPVAAVPLDELGRWCFGKGKEASGLKQAREMSAMLATFGYGMEPDPTHGAERPGSFVLLFRIADAKGTAVTPSTAFHHAALVAALLAAAERGSDGTHLISELATRLHLSAADAVRLAARYRLMRGRALASGRLRMIAGNLSAEERGAIAALAAAVAAGCGEVHQPTMAALERLHDGFGIDRRRLYAALHQGTAAGTTEPVVVEQGAPKTAAYRIPPPPPQAAPQDGTFAIDIAKVSAILRQTREVAEILAPIYEEDEPAVPAGTLSVGGGGRQEGLDVQAGGRFSGLDPEHARFLETLTGAVSWSRADFESRARAFGLPPDGAIETLNEWAYNAHGDEIIVDGDPLTINVALLPQLSRLDAPEEAA